MTDTKQDTPQLTHLQKQIIEDKIEELYWVFDSQKHDKSLSERDRFKALCRQLVGVVLENRPMKDLINLTIGSEKWQPNGEDARNLTAIFQSAVYDSLCKVIVVQNYLNLEVEVLGVQEGNSVRVIQAKLEQPLEGSVH